MRRNRFFAPLFHLLFLGVFLAWGVNPAGYFPQVAWGPFPDRHLETGFRFSADEAQASTTLSIPELPATASKTAGAITRLTWEMGHGKTYSELTRILPTIADGAEPEAIVTACTTLGFSAEALTIDISVIRNLACPFLVRMVDGTWMLFRTEESRLIRLEGNKPGTFVDSMDFVQEYGGHVVMVREVDGVSGQMRGPRLEMVETEHDFGDIWQGDVVDHAFLFQNVGDATLEITNIHASCGCTAALPNENKRSYAPGEKGEIRTTFNSHGKRGQQRQQITLNSNSVLDPVLRIMLAGNVKVPVEISPVSLQFFRIRKGENAIREVQILSREDQSFRIEKIEASAPFISWEIRSEEIRESDKVEGIRYWIVVTLDTNRMEFGQRVNERLVVETSSEKKPLLEIPIQAQVVGDLYVTSPAIHLGYLYPNRSIQRSLMIESSNPDLEVSILGAEFVPIAGQAGENAESINLLVEWKKDSENRYRVDVNVQTPEQPRLIEGQLAIRTNHPEQKVLLVDVRSLLPQVPSLQSP